MSVGDVIKVVDLVGETPERALGQDDQPDGMVEAPREMAVRVSAYR
ncbi:hypothetical protein ACWEHT_01085 [Streptomyces sp. NPDC004646]